MAIAQLEIKRLTLADHVRRHVAQHMDSIEAIAALTALAVDELGALHRYTNQSVLTTLQQAEQTNQGAGCTLTPTQLIALQRITTGYLESVALATEDADGKILDHIHEQSPVPGRRSWYELLFS